MSNKDDNKQDDSTKGGIIEGITGLTNAAQDAARQAKEASQTPIDHISDLATAAREAAEDAKKQQHARDAIAHAQAADAQHATQQAAQHPQTPADQVTQLAESARQAVEAAEKQKAIADAEHAARWARIEAESAKRAEEARQAEAQEQFQGSGGVNSQEQLDSLREGYANSGTADPSGLTQDADSAGTKDTNNSTS